MKLQQIHANVWIGGLLIILSVIFYMMAGSFSNPDAATWPHLILVCIIILSAMLVVNGLKQTFKAAEPGMIPAGLCLYGGISASRHVCAGTERLKSDSGRDRGTGSVCIYFVCHPASAEDAVGNRR